ncbi:MAG: hypothetical protein PQJ58_11205 [Spirochaetales bacterium]|nr:hypothetical protein [Spirochaetales bacterium]
MNQPECLSELNRALLSLEGLLYGIVSDDIINQKELDKLSSWKKQNKDKIGHHHVSELLRILDSVIGCRIIQNDEKDFLEEFCRRYGCCDKDNDPVLCDQIRMKGYIEGILADSKIYEGEIRSFREWLQERPHLSVLSDYSVLLENCEGYLLNRTPDAITLYSRLKEIHDCL